MSKIISFNNQFRFLSNFWPYEVVLDHIRYRTVEHAYQAAKTLSIVERDIINKLATPGQAKRYGKRVTLRKDWNVIKIPVMIDLIQQKFSKESALAYKLIETYPLEIEEGNTWGDTFWGICNDKGQNHLGIILMKQREFLMKDK